MRFVGRLVSKCVWEVNIISKYDDEQAKSLVLVAFLAALNNGWPCSLDFTSISTRASPIHSSSTRFSMCQSHAWGVMVGKCRGRLHGKNTGLIRYGVLRCVSSKRTTATQDTQSARLSSRAFLPGQFTPSPKRRSYCLFDQTWSTATMSSITLEVASSVMKHMRCHSATSASMSTSWPVSPLKRLGRKHASALKSTLMACTTRLCCWLWTMAFKLWGKFQIQMLANLILPLQAKLQQWTL